MSGEISLMLFTSLLFTAIGFVGFGPLRKADPPNDQNAEKTRRLFRILGPVLFLLTLAIAYARSMAESNR